MAEKKQPAARRKRADGELSRERILDAATEIAAERGYEGTSIALVSKKCGLPASSIYWHFKDKDDLIAAVIERSFAHWLAAWQVPDEGDAPDRMKGMADADRQGAAGLPRLHPAGADAGARTPAQSKRGPARCSSRPAPRRTAN